MHLITESPGLMNPSHDTSTKLGPGAAMESLTLTSGWRAVTRRFLARVQSLSADLVDTIRSHARPNIGCRGLARDQSLHEGSVDSIINGTQLQLGDPRATQQESLKVHTRLNRTWAQLSRGIGPPSSLDRRLGPEDLAR